MIAGYGLILLGSALGGLVRFWVSGLIAERLGGRFPWGTLVVNVTGAFLIGLVVALGGAGRLTGLDPALAQLAVLGFLGSYTTVSSFSLQTFALARGGQWGPAIGNVALSIGLCLAAAAIGAAFGAAAA